MFTVRASSVLPALPALSVSTASSASLLPVPSAASPVSQPSTPSVSSAPVTSAAGEGIPTSAGLPALPAPAPLSIVAAVTGVADEAAASWDAWANVSARFFREARASSARLTVASSVGASDANGLEADVGAFEAAGATPSDPLGVWGVVRSVLSVLTRSPYACTR